MNTDSHRAQIGKRWVVKIGSSLITNDGQGLNRTAIQSWMNEFAELRQRGYELILVSSGAVAEGMARLGWQHRASFGPAPKHHHSNSYANMIFQLDPK